MGYEDVCMYTVIRSRPVDFLFDIYSSIEISNTFISKVRQKTYTEKNIKLTVSIGLSTYTGESIDDHLNQTDVKMYKAKHQGRDCICYK